MNIFFPAGGRRVELINLFKKEVSAYSGKIIVGDICNAAPALYIADKPYILPNFKSNKFYKIFKDICEKEEVDLVIPLLDYELDYYSANYKRMQSDGIRVMISDPGHIDIFRNKKKTNEAFRESNIPAPLQYDLESRDKTYPVVIKPIKGSASMKISIADNQSDLEMITNKIGNKKVKDEFVIEAFVEGEEITSDVFVDLEGNIRAISQRQRIKVRAGEVERSKIVNYKQIDKYIKMFLRSSRVVGVINIQCFLSTEGPKFSEVNARFGGGYPLSYYAGCNFPRSIINMYGNELIQNMNAKTGCYMLRYDNAVYLNEKELVND
jgi:carbamoyl-phosphate synthase large subunit